MRRRVQSWTQLTCAPERLSGWSVRQDLDMEYIDGWWPGLAWNLEPSWIGIWAEFGSQPGWDIGLLNCQLTFRLACFDLPFCRMTFAQPHPPLLSRSQMEDKSLSSIAAAAAMQQMQQWAGNGIGSRIISDIYSQTADDFATRRLWRRANSTTRAMQMPMHTCGGKKKKKYRKK